MCVLSRRLQGHLHGQAPLSDFKRLAADALAITGEQPLVRWEAEGELVEQRAAAAMCGCT
jgi:uncharacterized protein